MAVAVLARLRSRRTVLIGVAGVLAVLLAGFVVVLVGPGGGEGVGSMSVPPVPASTLDSGAVAADRAGSRAAEAAPPIGVAAPDGMPAPGGVPVGGVLRSLVRTAQLTVEVGDPAASSRQVRTAAAAAGGMVVQEQSGDSGAWLVLRVPADALDRVVEDIGAVGKVTGRTSQVTDATEEVVDLDARVASQQASVARVRALLAQADSIGDVIAIESELARREADLDSLTGRLAALRDQVALSTLTVDLRTPGSPPVAEGDRAGFLGGLATGWDGLRVLGTAVAAVIGFLLPFLPVLAVLAGIGWLVRRVVRARRVPAPAGGPPGPGSAGAS